MRPLLVLCLAGLVAGCAYLRPTAEPIPTRWQVTGDQQADVLLVFLPGVKDTHHDIFNLGAPGVLADSGLGWDMVAVDAHAGYYRERSFLDRLSADVFEPAREKGYEQFWLTGPSLGGFGSLFYWCREGDADIAGVIAMAPHLGGDDIVTDIREAGGLAEWQADPVVGEEHERQLWTCLQNRPPEPPIWLAYGEADHLAPANALLAESLPPERVLTNEGQHRWKDWLPLWAAIFARIEVEQQTGAE